jgi:hypothetical protein
MRHTFASCFAALNSNDDLTPCLGHESPRVTFERYAAGVTKEHATEFCSSTYQIGVANKHQILNAIPAGVTNGKGGKLR